LGLQREVISGISRPDDDCSTKEQEWLYHRNRRQSTVGCGRAWILHAISSFPQTVAVEAKAPLKTPQDKDKNLELEPVSLHERKAELPSTPEQKKSKSQTKGEETDVTRKLQQLQNLFESRRLK